MFKDTPADSEIKASIDSGRSFSVVAGAGSGKTSSLIKALLYVQEKHGKSLRMNAQKVVCITYTKAAVGVISKRLQQDPLFAVSTIHAFLWGEIGRFQREIRGQLSEHLIPRRIEKKREEDNGGNSQRALSARAQVARFQADLDNLGQVSEFKYDERGGRDYSAGRLDHDDIIDLGALMIANLSIFRKVLGQKYPYFFIDEAQDTFPGIVEALNQISGTTKPPLVGYFGDPMQQIYEGRASDFAGPEGSNLIKKEENYRCSKAVINLLNAFRKDIQQRPSGDNAEGSVELRLIKTEAGEGPRKTYTDEQAQDVLANFDTAMADFGWDTDASVKRLFLTRQMIANRLKFSGLNDLFTGKYASRSAQEDYEDGSHFALKPFLDVLIPLKQAMDAEDKHRQLAVLRENSPLLDPKGTNATRSIKEIAALVEKGCADLVDAWDEKNAKQILTLAADSQLIALSERLKYHLGREPRVEEYDPENDEHVKDKADWLLDRFFELKMLELGTYRDFVFGETPFSTQHGVKGDEFPKVLVVYDDTEANWNQYSFSKLLVPQASGSDPTDGQRSRSTKLAYVCFSRAQVDLKIVLFTTSPATAKSELVDAGLFSADQISIQA